MRRERDEEEIRVGKREDGEERGRKSEQKNRRVYNII